MFTRRRGTRKEKKNWVHEEWEIWLYWASYETRAIGSSFWLVAVVFHSTARVTQDEVILLYSKLSCFQERGVCCVMDVPRHKIRPFFLERAWGVPV